MTTFTIETEDEAVLKAVQALLKGFKVQFKQSMGKPYNPEFVSMIKESENQSKEGKTVKFEQDTNLWDLVSTK